MADKCPKCGVAVEAGDVKCPACGVELPEPTAPPPPQKAAVLAAAMLPLIFLILFLVVIGGIIFAGVKIFHAMNKPSANAVPITVVSPPPVEPLPEAAAPPQLPNPDVSAPVVPAVPAVPAQPPAAVEAPSPTPRCHPRRCLPISCRRSCPQILR